MNWDIFCTVIDNFGDIGVTWRLARQLASEHGQTVRLWVDDLEAFRRIRPEVDPALPIQCLAGVEIRRWSTPLPEAIPGDVVIEALACDLPDAFLGRMAACSPKPVWLNLEYLTAEDWAKGVHGLPSPHPRLPLTRYFFMPGYEPDTGGLTREVWLGSRRRDFQATPDGPAALRRQLGLAAPAPGEILVSLFSYENAALAGLLDAWAADPAPVTVCVPEGKALPEIARWFGLDALPAAGDLLRAGGLALRVLPMLDQDAYDRLLWTCDLNFVRGEDSFVRAQFAARPLAWQAYRQAEEAHLAKLEAFLDLYCAGMEGELAELTRQVWRAWNRESGLGALWPAWRVALPALARHAELWWEHLAHQPHLASNLLIFCKKKLE